MAYTPPSVRAIRNQLQASVQLTGARVVPCFIGRSNGTRTSVSAYPATLLASATYAIPALGAAGPISTIVQIRTKASGGLVYVPGTDFTFDAGLQTITFTSTALPAPYVTKIEEVTGTSAFVDGTTYYYVVTALKTLNNTGPITGETVASNEVSIESSGTTKSVKLTWQSVPSAESYRIYRSVVAGDYTGSHLLATVSGEFTNTYTDVLGALSAGSPPGVAVYAQTSAATVGPYNLEPNQTLLISIDGGADQTATFTGARASRSASGAVYPITFVGTETLQVKVDGGATITITMAADASTTLLEVLAQVNAALTGGYADDTGGGQLRLNSDKRGSGSSIQVVGGTAIAALGLTTGTTTGTGNTANIDSVTPAEVVAVIAAIPLVGATASLAASGKPIITHDTAGLAYTLEITGGTANAAIAFTTGEIAGNTATAGTALKRPGLNASSANFYIDYTYVASNHFVTKQWTDLGSAIAEYGLGSDLAIAITLAMAGSGRGNSAAVVLAMSVPDNTLVSYQAALTALETRKDVNLVVPCTVVSGINAAVQAHCETMSDANHQRDREGIVGVPIGTAIGDASTSGTAIYMARALNSMRVALAFPWPTVTTQISDGTFADTEMDGWAMAAIVAGRLASLPTRSEPATMKQVGGVLNLGPASAPLEYKEIDMNLLGEAGVLVIDNDLGNFLVRDALLTTTDNQTDSQFNIILAEDLVKSSLRAQFKQYRGRKLLRNVLQNIRTRTGKVLDSLVADEEIVSYDPSSIAVTQDPTNLRRVKVSFRYKPIFGINEIEFDYGFDLTPISLAA